MGESFYFVYILAVLFAGGVLLLLFGLYGRRINDHLYCRKCRYDLSGLGARPSRCPECGADLTRWRAVRKCRRRRRPVSLVIGFAILLFLLAGPAVMILKSVEHFFDTTGKPVWWLRRDAESDVAVKRGTAQQELIRRLRLGELSEEQVLAIVDDALKLQADRSKPWTGKWGTFIELAWYGRYVDDETIASYLDGIYGEDWTFRIGRLSRPGGSLQGEVTLPKPRGAEFGSLFAAEFEYDAASLDDRDQEVEQVTIDIPPSTALGASVLPAPWSSCATVHLDEDAERGDHELTVRAHINFRLTVPDPSDPTSPPLDGGNPQGRGGIGMSLPKPSLPEGVNVVTAEQGDAFLERSLEWTVSVQIVEREALVVPVVTDPDLAGDIRSSVWIDRLMRGGPASGVGTVAAALEIVEPPVDLAFRVFVRINGVETAVESPVICRAGETLSHWFVSARVAELPTDASDVEFVFRSDPSVAEGLADITGVWEGKIVIKGAEWFDPSTWQSPAGTLRSTPENPIDGRRDAVGDSDRSRGSVGAGAAPDRPPRSAGR
jgi:hypothetical protein